MDTVVTPPKHIPASQTGLKPCQRSCKGLMIYFQPSPTVVHSRVPHSWRSGEPVCLGLSSARKGPSLDLSKLHAAREIPAEQHVDYSLVLGHAVYQANIDMKALPPGCMTGLEFVRFCKTQPNAATAAVGAAAGPGEGTASEPNLNGSSMPASYGAIHRKAITGSLKGVASNFRILTSDADTNARLSKTWSNIVDFNPQQYAQKFGAQAHKNWDAMSQWLRDLQNAVSKPKP